MIEMRTQAEEMIDLTINKESIELSFRRIANELMNDWMLVCGKGKYRIAELEFYYNSEQHLDPYTHDHKRQSTFGEWYIHPSGMDITIGRDGAYGGILMRAIQDLTDDKNYIYGPINCLTELFKNINNVELQNIPFGLKTNNSPRTAESVIALPRVGLNQIKSPDYFDKHYRYIVLPHKKHPGKENVRKRMLSEGTSLAQVKRIWGW